MAQEEGVKLTASIGIDFGNRNCSIAAYNIPARGEVTVFQNAFTSTSRFPTYVACAADWPGQYLAGTIALVEANGAPASEQGACDLKRHLGRGVANSRPPPNDTIIEMTGRVAFDARGRATFRMRATPGQTEHDTVTLLVGKMFRHLVAEAESYLNNHSLISEVAITIPCHFGPDKRAAVRESAAAAGLRVVGLIEDPVAATLGFTTVPPFEAVNVDTAIKGRRFAVVDMGDRCLTASILTCTADGIIAIEATHCDTDLGGSHFDDCVRIRLLLYQLKESTGQDRPLDFVLAVGGGMRLPRVRALVQHVLIQPIFIPSQADVMVARGAALFAHLLRETAAGNVPEYTVLGHIADHVLRIEWDASIEMNLHSNIRLITIISNNVPPEVSFLCKGQKLALKILRAGKILRPLTGRQDITLRSLRHPNVVEYLLCEEVLAWNPPIIGILMEYYPGGSLNSLVTETVLTDWETCWFLRQVANGLTYLHGITAYAHGDIRGSKVLLTADRLNCKISDWWNFFSLDKMEATDVNPSSLLHMSPELLFSTFNRLDKTNVFAGIGRAFGTPVAVEKQTEVEPADDIWSFGCLALEMFNKGQVPYVTSKGKPLQLDFNNPSRDPPAGLELLRQVKKRAHPDLSSGDSQHMSAPLKDIVKRCLSKPADRPVATELTVALENLMNRDNSPPQLHLIYSTDAADGEGFKLFFEEVKDIGYGTYADVYDIKPTNNNDPQKVTFSYRNYRLALKVLKWDKLDAVSKTALLSLDHPNVVRYICCGILPIDPRNGRPYPSPLTAVLMEYYLGGNLNELAKLKNLRNEDILRYLRQIAKGLSYLHARQFSSQKQTPIIHGDLKGENIFLSEDKSTCRIGDMENLYLLKEGRTVTAGVPANQGTLWHMSPELLLNICNPRGLGEEKKPTGIGRATDIWSFGCVVLELLNGGLVPTSGDATSRRLLTQICNFTEVLKSTIQIKLIKTPVDSEPHQVSQCPATVFARQELSPARTRRIELEERTVFAPSHAPSFDQRILAVRTMQNRSDTRA
ncbi:hypothetical protein BV898_17045 [Hypsibius exemplaris]|uniref:non-specific serine/threonine protein kinase n=1 Tax=Hypsibius exemplaris TaxID=2072580 RepID=A0A9X6RMG1_HYPEX|nr:hypothetical protein BV898_17045 [Hypsibius exemplaris]